ncbi:MAG: hypothetical protein IKM17_07205 [Lentisphaeria bacterium]|nr:hypothetical protein [Lentisphaeria bacterium]
MKIFVLSADEVKKFNEREDVINNYFITIRSHDVITPVLDFHKESNVLCLMFDDVEEDDDPNILNTFHYIVFNEDMAKDIHDFIDRIDKDKTLYINCHAGVSRSGAVGLILNEYFNRFLEYNDVDYKDFFEHNRQIIPNATVSKILKYELFGKPFQS